MTGLIRKVPLLRNKIAPLTTAWSDLWKTMFGTYRPERHYMRGPGPRFQAKYNERAGV